MSIPRPLVRRLKFAALLYVAVLELKLNSLLPKAQDMWARVCDLYDFFCPLFLPASDLSEP